MPGFRLLAVSLFSSVFLAAPAAGQTAESRHPVTVEDVPWLTEIRAFQAADRVKPPVEGGVLFVGGSSIALWPDLSRAFSGVNVIQRGFGGAELAQVVYYAPRIVIPYRPRLIFLYAGDNDIANGQSVDQVFKSYREFVSLVHAALPRTRIAFISIKPSMARWSLVSRVRAANALVKNFAASDSRLLYVDVFTPMLGPAGKPRAELFDRDQLHLNAAGYALWREHIEPVMRR